MSPRPRVAALLAGGEGRRLGGLSKEAIVFQGEALGPRLARLLRGSFDALIVVTRRPELYGAGSSLPAPASAPAAAAEAPGAPKPAPPLLSADLIPGFGPLSGLHAALSLARDAGLGEWLWLAACDMPRFDPRLLELLSAGLGAAIAEARSAGGPEPLAALARYGEHFEPFQALYSTRLIEPLEELFTAAGARASEPDSGSGATGLAAGLRRPSFKDLFRGREVLYVEEEAVRALSPDWGLFFNINRPEDLAALSSVTKLVEGDEKGYGGAP